MTAPSLSPPRWDDADVLDHAEQVARARTQSRRLAEQVAALPLPQVRAFVRRLWEHAGALDPLRPTLLVEPALAGDVAGLLRRLGIGCEQVDVDGQTRLQLTGEDRSRFLRTVALARTAEGAFGSSGDDDGGRR